MGTLQYAGKYPDSDSSVVPKNWADNENAAVVVDADYVNAQIAAIIAVDALQTKNYVDVGDALRAHKTDVDAGDALCVPAAALGAAAGVASLDSSGNLASAQVPGGVVTDRVAKFYDAITNGAILLAPGVTHQVTTSSRREYRLAYINIPDPGYPWVPIVFALVGGYSSGPNPGDRTKGTGNLGLLTVMPPSGVSDTIYAAMVCSGVYGKPSLYPVLPYGASGDTPATVHPVQGALELDLWGCNYSSNGYVFSGTGLTYQVAVFPAM